MSDIKPSDKYNEQASVWELTQDLLGGTRAMRAAAEKWLPREEKESRLRYDSRLNRSILYNALRDTLNKVAARPFGRPVKTDQDDQNVDRMGSDLTTFASEVFKAAMRLGRSHVLINFPSTGGTTLADQGEAYFSLVTADTLIDWEEGVSEEGVKILTRVVILEADDLALEIDAAKWVRYRKVKEKGQETWVQESAGEHTFGEVPIETLQLSDGFMSAEPVFDDLAWLNLAHWQSSSDQRNILKFARAPLILRTGFTQDELNDPVEIGPAAVMSSINPDAKMSFVEHTGKAIESGWKDLDRLEKQMEGLGMQPLVAPKVERTATEISTNDDRSMSDAQKWVKRLQNMLVEIYKKAAQWTKGTVEPSVDINMDFNMSGSDSTVLTQAAAADLLTTETWIREMQRRNLLSHEIDPVAEARQLSLLMDFDKPDPEDDKDDELSLQA